MDKTAYKVLTHDQFAALQAGTFVGAEIDQADGYIHLSTASQLTETVTRHFSGLGDIIIAAVDLAACTDRIRWEPSRHGDLFPHMYGHLRWGDVVAYGTLTWTEDGKVKLPDCASVLFRT